MADTAQEPILRRKADARRAALGVEEMTPAKAMRVALAKAGQKALHVPVALREFEERRVAIDALQEALPDPALLLRLEGSDEAAGIAILCPQTVAAVLEAQTLGRVMKGVAAPRRATATDASLCGGFVDLVLDGFSMLAAGCRGFPATGGYRAEGRFVDLRLAAMALEDARHLHLTAQLDFANGSKAGSLHFVLPVRLHEGPDDADAAPWSEALEKVVMGSPARLDAILCRIKLPLSAATALSVGQVVPLDRATLDSLSLVATNGRGISRARLGRSGPMRAVRPMVGGEGDTPPTASGGMSGLALAGAASADPPAKGPLQVPGPDLPEPRPGASAAPDPAGSDPRSDRGNPGDLDTPGELPALPEPVPLDLDLPE